MPKTFSDSERTYIKERLLEEAQTCLIQFGMRRTTVDELVRRVNIPKGTFYLFYSSKELLFFDVFCSIHDKIQSDVMRRIDELRENINEDTLTELIFQLYKQLDCTCIYSFAASGELELLMRKLPPEVVATHVQKDDLSMELFLSLLPITVTEERITLFSATLRAVFCTLPHKREIGEDIFDDVIRVMLRGVIAQLFKEEKQ